MRWLNEHFWVRWFTLTLKALGLPARPEHSVDHSHSLRTDVFIERILRASRCLWPRLFELFPAQRWMLELFVSRRPAESQLASVLSKAWELVRRAARDGEGLGPCRLGVVVLCWKGAPHQALWPGPARQVAPGVWLWDWRWVGLFVVELSKLPALAGYSALRLLYRPDAERLRALLEDETLEEEVKVAAMGVLKEVARDVGYESWCG